MINQLNFNSHLLTETNIVEVICFACFFISIHVSLRRRTIWTLPHHSMVPFQFTSPFGDELLSSLACAKTLQFQLASPQGDELFELPCPRNQIVFQLTSPQGDELKNPREFAPEKIFQLTSPRGDEPYLHLHLLPQRQLKFQFTSPRGDELKMARVLIRVYHFNSRLREGTNTFFQVFFKRIFSITTHIPARRRT